MAKAETKKPSKAKRSKQKDENPQAQSMKNKGEADRTNCCE